MSVVLKSRNADLLDNVFIFYDFKQVHDAMMIVTFDKKTKSWEKVFVYNSVNGWEINDVKRHVDDKKFKWISKKLDLIFHQNKIDVHLDDINLDEVIRSESKFVLALNRVEG